MDTAIVYPGQVPEDTDLLRAGKYAQKGLGDLADIVYGRKTAAYGFSVTGSTSSLAVTVGSGLILTSGALLATALGGQGGGLTADSTTTTKQYVLAAPASVTIPAAGVTYTLYATCQDTDTDNSILPFWSASSPDTTQAGPGNAGTSLATRRTSAVTLSLAISAPATPTGGAVVALGTVLVSSGYTTGANAIFTRAANLFWLTIPEIESQLNAQASGRLLSVKNYTSPTTYTPSSAAKKLLIEMVGGGGAGGGSVGSATSGQAGVGSAGGAGAFIRATVDLTTLSLSGGVALTLGAAGTGVMGYSGNAGGASSFGGYLTCGGGAGGSTSGSVTLGASQWTTQSYGGTVTVVATPGIAVLDALPGANGMSSIVVGTAEGNLPIPQVGPDSPFGTGGYNGNTYNSSNVIAKAASGYGAGGGGGGTATTGAAQGGDGAPGLIRIWEYS